MTKSSDKHRHGDFLMEALSRSKGLRYMFIHIIFDLVCRLGGSHKVINSQLTKDLSIKKFLYICLAFPGLIDTVVWMSLELSLYMSPFGRDGIS